MKKTLAIMLAVLTIFTVGCAGQKQETANNRPEVTSPVLEDPSFQTKKMGKQNQLVLSYPADFVEQDANADKGEIFAAWLVDTSWWNMSATDEQLARDHIRIMGRISVCQIDFPHETDSAIREQKLSDNLSREKCMEIIEKARADFDTMYVSGSDAKDYIFEYTLLEGDPLAEIITDASVTDVVAPLVTKKYGNCDGVSFSYTVTVDDQATTYYNVIINGKDDVNYLVQFEAVGGDMSVFAGAEEYIVVR